MAKNKKILLIVGTIVLLVVIATICLFAFKDKEKAIYVVAFNSNSGSTISEQNIEEGMSATKPQDPIRDGYIFIEWLLNGESYDFNNVIDEDITLTAKWEEIVPEKEMVTIKFNSDGGTTIANSVIEKGSKVEKPVDPAKEGYTFVEWQLAGTKYDFELEVPDNLELVAKWEENKGIENKPSNNSGNNNSGNNKPTTPSTPNTTETPSVPTTPTTPSTPTTPTEPTEPTKPVEPTVNKYTVTFNSNGGSAVASQTITEGGKASKPANPTRNGYTFASWTLNGKVYDFNSAVTGNITLVANWTENVKAKYTVTFNSNGGSSVASQTITEGSKATKPSNPTREGYNFAGWTLNGNTYDFNSAVTGNITLTAKWTQKTYTIKATPVDTYSPDRILTVLEDGKAITVKAIKYSNGATLCNGNNTTVFYGDIQGVTSYIVVLSGGTQVNATLK